MIRREDSPSGGPARPRDESYTAPGEHTTAAAIGKRYDHEFPPSDDTNKSPDRTSDAAVSSGRYARSSQGLQDRVTPQALQLEFHHPLEKWLARRPFRWLLRRLSVVDRNGKAALERIIESYRNPDAPLWQRVLY